MLNASAEKNLIEVTAKRKSKQDTKKCIVGKIKISDFANAEIILNNINIKSIINVLSVGSEIIKMIDFKNEMVISKEEWSLFYDMADHFTECDFDCHCEYVDSKCIVCRAREWMKDDEEDSKEKKG